MNEEVCRLCLNAISGTDSQPIENLINILDELLLNLNLNVCSKAVVCYRCVNNLQMFFNLKKSQCTTSNTKFIILPDVKSNVPEGANSTDIKSFENQTFCQFCRKLLGLTDYVSLNETKDNMLLVDMLQKHIPEGNLNCTGELLSCYTCLDSLQSFINFIKNCLELEEKINRYIEVNGANDKGQIDLNELQKFTFFLSKCEAGCTTKMEEGDIKCQGNMLVETEADIKSEDVEIDNTDINIKLEELDIVEEENGYESLQESSAIIKINKSLDTSSLSSQRQEKCLNQHDLTYINPEGITMYKCGTCSYETKRWNQLNQHKLIHERSDVTVFKCNLCPYETKRQRFLNRHELTHESPSKIPKFRCDLCLYEATHSCYLKRHKLIHKSTSEITMFKCEICTFESKHKYNLSQHRQLHDSSSMFICKLCPYNSKHRGYFKRHEITHISSSELTMFKCDMCPYEAKFKNYLMAHKLIHKSLSEITMFKCDLCLYKTKRKRDLKQHKLSHKSTSELTMFKCDMCPYETIHVHNLKRHKVTHKRISEITVLKCKSCSYETKYDGHFKRHNSTHKRTSV